MRQLFTLIILLFSLLPGITQDNFTEDFDLNLGSLNNQNEWSGNTAFQVVTDLIMLAGYPQTNTESKALKVQSSGGNIERDNLLVTTFTSGAAYLSFLIRIDTQDQLPTAPSLQLGFEKATFSSTFCGFGFYEQQSMSGNTIRAALTTQSSGDEVVTTSEVFTVGTVYHVVLKYEFLPAANDVLKVYISSTFMATEPALANLTTTVNGTGIPDNIGKILIDAPPGSSDLLVVDGLQMGNTWNGFFDPGLLPVELVDFQGKMNHKGANLSWRTLNEVNNQGFLVERSNDGRHFTTIGEVNGYGDSNTPRDYQYTDTAPLPGTNYYRLTQIDFSGATEHSEIIALQQSSPSLNVRIYPNPTADYLYVDFSEMAQPVVSGDLVIQRSDGQPMLTTFRVSGQSQMIDVNDWPAGWYVLHIRDGDKVRCVKTFLVQ